MHKIDFLNRNDEFLRLKNLLNSSTSELVVLWGRRRVGKTRLLQKWNQHGNGLYWVADESSASIQRKYFAKTLDQCFPGFSEVEYPDWQSLLSRISKEAKSNRWTGPLIIDEFPYLVAADKSISSIFQHWIDNEAREAKLLICLCGSSQRMMHDQFLDAASPLYGRASEIIRLAPLKPGYLLDINPKVPIEKYFSVYSLLGGIPRYWELVKDWKKPIEEIANEIALSPDGILHEEVNRLLRAEQPSAMSLKPILDAIGLGVHKVSEIGSRLQQPTSSFSRPISELVNLGFVKREIPFGDSEKTSKRALYSLADPFLLFWFTVIAANKSILTSSTDNIRQQLFKRYWPDLRGKTWENLCQQALISLEENKFTWLPPSRFWQNKEHEWDVVSMNFERTTLLLGECKYLDKTITAKQLQTLTYQLIEKGTPPLRCKIPSKIEYRVFINKLPQNKPHLPNNVKVYDLNDIFRALR